MKRIANWAAAAAFAASLIGLGSAHAADEVSILAHASATVSDLKHDPVFGDGVLLARTRRGWSQPAFYTLGSASFGLQIGLEQAQLVMFIMSDRALRGIEQGKFKLGAGAGLTVITLGASAEAATPANLAGDIIVWAVAKGAYGGITLNGSIVAPQDSTNADFYRRRVSVHDILMDRVSNPAAANLRANLARAW
jgi:lipid-binding SYLF domain-containing protein